MWFKTKFCSPESERIQITSAACSLDSPVPIPIPGLLTILGPHSLPDVEESEDGKECVPRSTHGPSIGIGTVEPREHSTEVICMRSDSGEQNLVMNQINLCTKATEPKDDLSDDTGVDNGADGTPGTGSGRDAVSEPGPRLESTPDAGCATVSRNDSTIGEG